MLINKRQAGGTWQSFGISQYRQNIHITNNSIKVQYF